MFESGEGASFAVSVMDEAAISPGIIRVDMAGGDLTDFLGQLMRERGVFVESDVVYDIKEKLCYVAEDSEQWICVAGARRKSTHFPMVRF